ncbi:MAG: HNH endonuclease [Verrucomicrobiaceae bacterium]
MPADRPCSFDDTVEMLYALHVGIVGKGAERHERPHKPLLLLAVLDLIAMGKATPDRILWCRSLRERFTAYFEVVRRRDDQDTPENPFFYLRQEGWWHPVRRTPAGIVPLESTPLVRDMAGENVWASITGAPAMWLLSPHHRLRLREALIARYFPQARPALSLLFIENQVAEGLIEPEDDRDEYLLEPPDGSGEDDERPGRSAGFRRVVLEAYDFQCAACGLRIRLPERDDLTFVDAAHLIPFRDAFDGGNDHPTNGIALCKNHHWAMDRFLIAPTPEGRWQVSSVLDARRSAGEADLLALHQRRVLLPGDEAFHPSAAGVEWRVQRLAA